MRIENSFYFQRKKLRVALGRFDKASGVTKFIEFVLNFFSKKIK